MFLTFLTLAACRPIYKDPSRPINDRIDDLMAKMTLEEKLGQLVQVDGNQDFIIPFMTQHIGSVISVMADRAKLAIDLARNSKLQIPLLIGVDAIHGNAFYQNATVFPSQLASSCSWDEELIEQIGNITASEMRYTGASWTFSPVLCVARDPRWPRVDETFGDDPLLISKFGAALIRGLQGKDGVSSDPEKVMATAKHFAAYSQTLGGRDASEAELTKRKLHSFFLPPFEEAVKAKVGSFMTGFSAIDGVPATMNKWLLRETLRKQWNFEGMVVTDYDNVGYLVNNQFVAKDYVEAATLAVNGGNDMIMQTPDFYENALTAIKSGKLNQTLVELACRNVLKAKFELGLFEDDRYPDYERAKERVGTEHNRNIALKVAEESLVLLKNDGSLPLDDSKIKSIAVIGPNADHVLQQNGDWSLGSGQINVGKEHPRNLTITILDGIKNRFKGTVTYEMGAGIEKDEHGDIDKAIEAVNAADISIVVIGDRFPFYGETKPTATLDLQGEQTALLDAIVKTKKKFILATITSKPLAIPKKYSDAACAEIVQFTPGMMGGKAFAEAIFGDINPSGKLTMAWPKHIGQIPVSHNQIRSEHGTAYADMDQSALHSFGWGLTYTSFSYVSAKVNKDKFSENEDITVTVTIKNTGKRDGTEIIQVYSHDDYTSTTWADKELKGYARVFLKAGETKEVPIVIPAKTLSIVNSNCERVVEPGTFELRIGPLSYDFKYKLKITIE